ncbi:hypothetical protein NIES2119_19565 [[Phormidium ambiguum] IAM M-71]|uniref:Uncharacterized protein n=1 Tax=[Phormidium ambiguum] IAM M-71 TaxID=454136 RepID=A0A1U7IFE3_9CYAN|nr:hypothetical protein [Phormidium ambiguum]OKH35697.1 hypothetical protein NIES2119_19565 [Phormidium ambiguum IAM M-71]
MADNIQQKLDESLVVLTDWLTQWNKIYAIQEDLNRSIQKLDNWIVQWKQIYAIRLTARYANVCKKSYTLTEATALAAVFGCSVVKVGTKYNLLKNNKVLFTGSLVAIVDYCFNNLIDLPSQ